MKYTTVVIAALLSTSSALEATSSSSVRQLSVPVSQSLVQLHKKDEINADLVAGGETPADKEKVGFFGLKDKMKQAKNDDIPAELGGGK